MASKRHQSNLEFNTANTTMVNIPLLIELDEVLGLMSIKKTTYYTLKHTGRFGPEPLKLCRKVLFNRDEVISWINAGCPSKAEWLRKRGA